MNGDAQSFESDQNPEPAQYRAGDEPIPGYRLLEPLGRGGFGEVWKCQAPGGFHKAIKFVRGAQSGLDEAQHWLAQQELQAIELIKNIRHPFILTVERAELQDGTLMIVMELADKSLGDHLQHYQKQGERGVPRAELLGYLTEAAEALDLMNFQHGLQHLDVKPQNLFLVGGHVKVADFGLVNRLPQRKKSDDSSGSSQGARGITPRYVAPEILRHRISRRSDQYSLAIVYQELLTGELPFKGRTGRQLFMQHMQAAPDLAGLPDADRGPVARALAKDPEERFASCEDLVRALGRSGTIAPKTNPAIDILGATPTAPASVPRTDPVINIKGTVSLADFQYLKRLGQTPLGEIWQVQSPSGETQWAYHLQGFAVEATEQQQQALAYLQGLRHPSLMRFKIAEAAPHRIILVFEPWGPSVSERCRSGKLRGAELLLSLGEAAHAIDELTPLTNMEHLALSPETIVSGLDSEQLRDFGFISLLWKSGQVRLAGLNPRYGAPELSQGRSSAASDQYSLAVTYLDLRTFELSGKPWAPAARSAGKFVHPGSAELQEIPVAEREVLARALDADPSRRFGTCVEMIEALGRAQGGVSSQVTTALHGALAATQQSFLATVHEWIASNEAREATEAGTSAGPAGRQRHIAYVEIVAATVMLRLQVFEQEWHAQRVSATENEFRYFLPLPPSIWQRLRGTPVGVAVHVLIEPIDPKMPRRCRATITIQPVNCSAAATHEVTETIGPAMLRSVLQALNAAEERRNAGRLPCRANVTLRYRPRSGRPTEQQGEVVDISRTGIGLTTDRPLEAGGEIRLLLALPQESGQPLAVLLKARVTRCEPFGQGLYLVGAEFLREPDKTE
jgi:serine/threonine protein kinase